MVRVEEEGDDWTMRQVPQCPQAWISAGRWVCPRLGAIRPRLPSKLHHAAAHALQHRLEAVVHTEGLQEPLAIGVGRFFADH